MGKPQGKRPLKLRRGWEDSIKMDVKETYVAGRGQVSLGSGQRQTAGCCEHSDEP